MKKIILSIIIITAVITANSQEYKTVNEAKGLEVGKTVPNFKALDKDSVSFDLYETLKKGPVVLVFYRGEWCPICNKHLKTLQDSLSLIYEKGATVIAISPQQPQYLNEMSEKTESKFNILYDKDYKIANLFDVNYLPKTKETAIYNSMLGAKLKTTQSDDSQQLPIPATYIINKDAKIIWRHFDPNYKKRSTVADILKALE